MGTVSRVHTFASGAILTAAQLNNEFDNLLTSSAINGGLDATNLGVTAGQATASKALVVDASRNLADATGSNRINNLALSGTFESTGAITASAGITSGGNIVSDTDSTDDLGTTGVRWANLFVDDVTVTNNVTIGGTLTLTGGITLNGNTTIGDSSADTLTVNSTITSNLIFTDATYDIGASGATRPRDLFLSRNAVMGGTLGVTGLITATGGVSGALTGNVTGDLSGSVTGGTISGTTATFTGGLTGTTATFSGLISGNGGAEIGSNTAKVKFYSDSTYSGIYNGSSLTSDESYYFGSGDHFWYSDGAVAMKIDNGDFAVGTDLLFVDVSASAVGVGTSSPASLSNYSLITASDTSGGGLVCQYNGTSKLAVYSANNDAYYDAAVQHVFRTGGVFGGSTAMVIDSSQRIGIGQSSPSHTLDVNGSMQIERNGSSPLLRFTDTSSSSRWIGIPDGSSRFAIYGTNGSTEEFVLDSSGNVGIGTSAPVALSNQTSLTINGTSVGRVDVKAGGGGGGVMFGTSSALTVQANSGVAVNLDSASGQPITFQVGSSEKARILSSGGITFNGGTSSSEALSDYEQGSWTPTILGFTGTYGAQSGSYVKIGQIVHASCYVTFSSITSMDGQALKVSGFPFAAENSTSVFYAGNFGNFGFLDLPTGTVQVAWNIGNGLTYSTCRAMKDNADYENVLNTAITSTSFFMYVSWTYRTA